MTKVFASALALVVFAAMAAPALSAPAQRFPLPDLSLVSPNACTGDLTTVALSNRVIVIHEDVDPTGRHHLAVTITGDVATADGFSGRFNTTFGDNVSGPVIVGEFRGFLALTNSTFTLQNGSGALLLLHAVSHVTIPAGSTGELKGQVDIVSVACLGNPN
jgi:hypothetical protein